MPNVYSLGSSYIAFIRRQIDHIREGGTKEFLRKIKLFLKHFGYFSKVFPLLPIIIVVRLLRPFLLIRFGTLINSRIGHFAANTEVYLCERDAGLYPKRVFDVFFYWDKTFFCNLQLKKMWERSRLLRIWNFSRYLYYANRLLPGYEKHIIADSDRDIHNLFERIPPHLSFTPEEEEKGYTELKRIGIPDEAKFICFFARDSLYLNTIFQKKNWDYHNYRDANIHNYIPAVEELVKRGYFAFRMGAVVKKPLKIFNPKIIDYAVKYRTDFMDIYLIAKCQFFLCSTGGIEVNAPVFRRPVVHVNFVPIEYVPSWNRNSLFIPKKLWLRKERRFMTFCEILKSGAGRFLETKQYDQIGVEVVENTPEEIRAVAVEMDERLKGSWQTNEEDEELQRRFWSLFKPSELHGIFKIRVGSEFLHQNQGLLK